MNDDETSTREGIPWRAMLADKAIDIVLIPLSLFAALWLQDWVDARAEQSDYVSQLEAFRSEVTANREKGAAMEKQIGPLSERDPDHALGPLGAVFPLYDKVVAFDAELVECLQLTLTPPKVQSDAELAELAKTEEGRARLQEMIAEGDAAAKRDAACNDILAGKTAPPEMQFEVVDLSPLYRYEVWQMYLQDGIKLFKDDAAHALGRSLGEAYALAHEIEVRVAEIENNYNDELVHRLGTQAAVQAEVERELDVVLDSDGKDQESLARLHAIAGEIRRARYSMLSFQTMLDTKVARLKSFVGDMTTRLSALDQELAAEIVRND